MKARLLVQLLLEETPEESAHFAKLAEKVKQARNDADREKLAKEAANDRAEMLRSADFVISTENGPVKLTAENASAVFDVDLSTEKFIGLHEGCERPESKAQAASRKKAGEKKDALK